MRPLQERQIFRCLNDALRVNDIGSVASQWFQAVGGQEQLHRVVNSMSLQSHALASDVQARDSYMTSAKAGHRKLIGACAGGVRLLIPTIYP